MGLCRRVSGTMDQFGDIYVTTQKFFHFCLEVLGLSFLDFYYDHVRVPMKWMNPLKTIQVIVFYLSVQVFYSKPKYVWIFNPKSC